LGTADRTQADRLAIPVLAEFDEMIRLAERGEWPPIDDERLYEIAEKWWGWFLEGLAKRLKSPAGQPYSMGLLSSGCFPLDEHALAGDADLSDSVTQFISERGFEVRPGSSGFARLKLQCQRLHHKETEGYAGEIEARRKATYKILDAIDGLEIDPQKVAAAIEGNQATVPLTVPVEPPATLPPTAPFQHSSSPVAVAPYKFADLLADWAREREGKKKTRYSWGKIINKLIRHLHPEEPDKSGENPDHILDYDAGAVTEYDLSGWKDKLVSSGLGSTTIKNYLTILRTLYNFAIQDSKRLVVNPAVGVKYRGKPGSKRKRRSYTAEDAKRILEAARKENDAHLRWVPWIEGFTGARLEEVCGANAADVHEFGGVWVLDIRLDHRGDDASIKNEGSERRVPLHPAIIAEGFLDYVNSLPKKGPLFPHVTPDRFGSRAGNGTKTIGRWIRKEVGITDPRKAPNHSWRHYFISICRDFEVDEEYRDALTGHKGKGGEGRDYGEYYVRVLYREICKIKSPVCPEDGDSERYSVNQALTLASGEGTPPHLAISSGLRST
jgi:integrase